MTSLHTHQISIIPVEHLPKKYLPILPSRATELSVGYDLRAYLPDTESLILLPLQRASVSCGFRLSLPPDVEAQIRPRSGLALHNGITVLNAPGTIDPDYKGVVQVILVNLSDQPFCVMPGAKIAQMVFAKVLTNIRIQVVSHQGHSYTELEARGGLDTGVLGEGEELDVVLSRLHAAKPKKDRGEGGFGSTGA